MSVQSLPVPSNLRTEGMCYAQNRLSYLLWNGCPQIVSGSLYCLNQRAGRYHLQRQAVLHLYRRPPAVCHLVGREQLQGRVYGAYRDVLAPYLRLIVIRSLRKKHFDRQHVGGRVSIIHPHATNSQWTILSNTEF